LSCLIEQECDLQGGGERGNNHRAEQNRSRRAVPIIQATVGSSKPAKSAVASPTSQPLASPAPPMVAASMQLDPIVTLSPFRTQSIPADDTASVSSSAGQPLKRSTSLGVLDSAQTVRGIFRVGSLPGCIRMG
jgi:hypothetical protein